MGLGKNDSMELLEEIKSVVNNENLDKTAALQIIQVKLSVYLAQHPQEAVELTKIMDSEFMRRRLGQLLA